MNFLTCVISTFFILQTVSCAFEFKCETNHANDMYVHDTNILFRKAVDIWKCGKNLKEWDVHEYSICVTALELPDGYSGNVMEFSKENFSTSKIFNEKILETARLYCRSISEEEFNGESEILTYTASGGKQIGPEDEANNEEQESGEMEDVESEDKVISNEKKKKPQVNEEEPDKDADAVEGQEGKVQNHLKKRETENSEENDNSKKQRRSRKSKDAQKNNERKKGKNGAEISNSNINETEATATKQVDTSNSNLYLYAGIGVAVIFIIGVAAYFLVCRGGKEAEPDLEGSAKPGQFNQSQYHQYPLQPGQQYPQYPQQPGQQYPPPQHPPQYQQPNPQHQQ